MKILALSLSIALLSCIDTGTPKRLISINDFNLSFKIPNDTKFSDSSFDSKGRIIKDTSQFFPSSSLKLFSIKDQSFNGISGFIFTDSNISNWEDYYQADIKFMFKQLSEFEKIKIIDTSYSFESINNTSFLKEHIQYYRLDFKDTVNRNNYYTRINTTDKVFKTLNIIFEFTNREYEKKYLDIVTSVNIQK